MSCVIKCNICEKFYGTDDIVPHTCKTVTARASFTNYCSSHNKYHSSDLTCPDCFMDEAIKNFHKKEEDQLFGEEPVGNEFDWAEPETSAKPKRYNNGTLEVWDAIEQLNFDYMQGNVLKYISRYKDKKGPEDLAKAINYIIKMISQETGIDYYELHKLSPEELAKRIKK